MNEVFEFVPYKDEDIVIKAIVLKEFEGDENRSLLLCYAQNRLFTVYSDGELKDVICDYCIIPNLEE